MKRITRYIVVELLVLFGITLTAMTVLMILVGIAQEAMRQGLGLVAILRLIPYVLPNALLFAVPGTILFAVCSVYGRMSAENEIIAVKALGVSPAKVIMPALILAFIASLVTVCLNDIAVSWGRKGMNRVVIESVEQIAYGMLRSQRSYSTRQFSINVKSVQDRKLLRPTLVIYRDSDDPPITLTAQVAELKSDIDRGMLIVALTNGAMECGKFSVEFPDTEEYEIPLQDASRKASDRVKPSNYPLRAISDRIGEQNDLISTWQQSLATEAAFQLISGQFDRLTSEEWTSNHQFLQNAHQQCARIRTEPWRRWANGFSCLCFVVVGVPWAIIRRNADFFSSFGTCFVPILIVYYPLLMFGVDRAKSGAVEPYMVWTGNVVLLGIGYWLMRKVLRY